MSIFGTIRRMFSRGASRPSRTVVATYDAARLGDRNEKHWVGADCLDADAAHSPAVRKRISTRARMETGNNGFGKGINLTQANYVVGLGPSLQMGTASKGFNRMVEARWKAWAKRAGLARKLRTACKSKVTDGESFIIIRTNPNIADPVKLDLVGIECEQCASPNLPYAEVNRIDGIKFDEFGNVLWYEVLKQHPGGLFSTFNLKTEQVPAKYMLHWFREDRPGQHRGICEITATLNRFAEDRRWREATIAMAENRANLSAFLKTQGMPDDGPDASPPFQTFPMERGMITQMPYGHDIVFPSQNAIETGHSEFVGTQISEEARPLNMPRNIAACDSSDYSFSGGQLDHLTYFVSIDVERDDCESMVLDKLFEIWFPLAVEAYGWSEMSEARLPAYSWSWPARPVIDGEKVANANRTNLATGCASLRQIWAAAGKDFDDVVTDMAEDYGVTEEEVKKILVDAIFKNGNPQGQQPAKPEETSPKKQPAAKANGFHNRLAGVLG